MLTIQNGRLPVGFIFLRKPVLIGIVETGLRVCVLGGAECQNKLDARELCLLSNFLCSLESFRTCVNPQISSLLSRHGTKKGNNPSCVNSRGAVRGLITSLTDSGSAAYRIMFALLARPMHERFQGGAHQCELCQPLDLSTLQWQLSASRSPAVAFLFCFFFCCFFLHYQPAFSVAAFICSSSPAVGKPQVLERRREQLLRRRAAQRFIKRPKESTRSL